MGNTQGVAPGGAPPVAGGGGDASHLGGGGAGAGVGGTAYSRNAYEQQQQHQQQQQQQQQHSTSSTHANHFASPSAFDHAQQQQQQQSAIAPPIVPNDRMSAGSEYGMRIGTPNDMVIDQQQSASPSSIENLLDDDTVPTVFRWEHGGRQVYITGTFNGWSRQIPMHRSGNDFTYIHNLKRGKHAFKFIVDDEWRFAPDQPTVADIEGRINNFIDVTAFKPYTGDREFEKEKAAAFYGAVPGEQPDTEGDLSDIDTQGLNNRPDQDGEVFSHNMPDVDDYTKEPPPLPPHLRHIILNKPPQLKDTASLPVPQHVALNHLYCTAIKDNMMVLGITQRYKTKFVTTVYYSPCSSK